MKHSVIIPLSRQEEDTLRLIAHGISSTRHLMPDDLDQLAKLRLVDRLDGKVTLSELGQVRLAQSQEEQFLSIIRAARDHQAGLRVV
jgi:RNase P/RNase MRP subunit POP5